jgi:hypothetical protein
MVVVTVVSLAVGVVGDDRDTTGRSPLLSDPSRNLHNSLTVPVTTRSVAVGGGGAANFRVVDAAAAARLEVLLPAAAIIVATRDDRLRTHITRGWGARLDAGSGRLELALTTSDDPSIVPDLQANGAVAVTAAMPTTYEAMQVKGTVEWMGELTPEALERVDAHLDAFLVQVMSVGMTSEAACMFGTGLVGVRIVVDQVFEQTPGAHAGRSV